MYKVITAALALALGAQSIQIQAELEANLEAETEVMKWDGAPFALPKCGTKPEKNPMVIKCHNKVFSLLDKDGSADISK